MKINPIHYVVIIVILSVIGVLSIVVLELFNQTDNTSTATIILSFLAPTILSIIAMMVKDVHKDINGRMTELLQKTEIASHAEGKAEGKAESRNREND